MSRFLFFTGISELATKITMNLKSKYTPRLVLVVVFFLNGSLSLSGEEAEYLNDAQIIGPIFLGESKAPPVVVEDPRDYRIQDSVVQMMDGEVVTINKVATPEDLMSPKVEEVATPEVELTDAERAEIVSRLESAREEKPFVNKFVLVSPTIYAGETSFVQWWCEGEQFEAWSNVDFNLLGGFHEVQGRGSRYTFVMSITNVKRERYQELLSENFEGNRPEFPELPTVAEFGPGYLLTKGDDSNEDALRVMDIFHDLFEKEQIRLQEAYEQREQNRVLREEDLRKNPPIEKDTVIHFWTEE